MRTYKRFCVYQINKKSRLVSYKYIYNKHTRCTRYRHNRLYRRKKSKPRHKIDTLSQSRNMRRLHHLFHLFARNRKSHKKRLCFNSNNLYFAQRCIRHTRRSFARASCKINIDKIKVIDIIYPSAISRTKTMQWIFPD